MPWLSLSLPLCIFSLSFSVRQWMSPSHPVNQPGKVVHCYSVTNDSGALLLQLMWFNHQDLCCWDSTPPAGGGRTWGHLWGTLWVWLHLSQMIDMASGHVKTKSGVVLWWCWRQQKKGLTCIFIHKGQSWNGPVTHQCRVHFRFPPTCDLLHLGLSNTGEINSTLLILNKSYMTIYHNMAHVHKSDCRCLLWVLSHCYALHQTKPFTHFKRRGQRLILSVLITISL